MSPDELLEHRLRQLERALEQLREHRALDAADLAVINRRLDDTDKQVVALWAELRAARKEREEADAELERKLDEADEALETKLDERNTWHTRTLVTLAIAIALAGVSFASAALTGVLT